MSKKRKYRIVKYGDKHKPESYLYYSNLWAAEKSYEILRKSSSVELQWRSLTGSWYNF